MESDFGFRKVPFEELFEELEDIRNPSLIRYPLREILFLVLVGTLCGCDKLTLISVFGLEKLDWFRKYYPYNNGMPAHDTLGRVLGMIDKKKFELLFKNWVSAYFELKPGTLVNIDGKHIKGSANDQDKIKKRDEGGDYAEIVVNAYASGAGIALAQSNVSESMSEIQGALELLDWLELEGCCITGDSNFCRHGIVNKIIDKKADYLLALKGNARNIYDATQLVFLQPDLEMRTFDSKDRGHGRKEHRIYRAIDVTQLPEKFINYFTQSKQIVEVTRHRKILRSGKETKETHYYITSLKTTVVDLAEKIRNHWLIENQLHYVLDVSWGEDDSRLRQKNAATNLSLIRKMSFNLLKIQSSMKGSIKARQLRCAISDQQRENILKVKMMR